MRTTRNLLGSGQDTTATLRATLKSRQTTSLAHFRLFLWRCCREALNEVRLKKVLVAQQQPQSTATHPTKSTGLLSLQGGAVGIKEDDRKFSLKMSDSTMTDRPSSARRKMLRDADDSGSIPVVSNFFPLERYFDAADKVRLWKGKCRGVLYLLVNIIIVDTFCVPNESGCCWTP
jgi:hypothetical protein